MLRITGLKRLNEPAQKWLNIWEMDYVDSRGKERKHFFASRNKLPKPECAPVANAVIAICRYGDKLLITKEVRCVVGGEEWGFVAGLIEEGETAEQAAIREGKQETGLNVVRITGQSPSTPSSAGMTDEAAIYIFCDVEGELTKEFLEGDEDIDGFLLDYNETVKLCDRIAPYDTGVVAARAWPILYMYKMLGMI